MNQSRWSLASRLTKLFAITTSALVLVITLVSAAYLRDSAERSLEGLLREELDEMMSSYEDKSLNVNLPELLAADAEKFQQEHSAFPMAWQVWEADGKTEKYVLGRQELLSQTKLETGPESRGRPQGFENDLRGMIAVSSDNRVFGCIVDGSSTLGELRRYCLIGALLVLATIVLIFAAGHILVGRVATTLREVAKSARNVRGTGAAMSLNLNNAPMEVREIVTALQEMLTNVQGEAERNRVFTASLAHELRSPIQNLMGETEVALMTERNGQEYRRVLSSHLQDLRDLADAVDNLVTICAHQHAERGHSETRESFELAPEAKLRLEREANYAQAHGVNLSLETEGDTRVYGDREGLLRAMRNLTANAIEWSAPGSKVDVRIRGENGRVLVTVDDSGPGIPEELKERIFEPFFRGPQAKGRRIGYGLGLAIVRSAVSAHGGEIEIGRSPMGGARFSLRLPRNLHRPGVEETPVPS